jgi:hypothetical protein
MLCPKCLGNSIYWDRQSLEDRYPVTCRTCNWEGYDNQLLDENNEQTFLCRNDPPFLCK